MPHSDFLDKHALKTAFLGNTLDRLVDLIVNQGNEYLSAAGVTFPARAVSTMLLISERDGITAADIAAALAQPHQLATQRVELLLKLGVIARQPDPDDGRRKVLILSEQGKSEVARMQQCLAAIENALTALQAEIKCNLQDGALRAIKALSNKSITDRTTMKP